MTWLRETWKEVVFVVCFVTALVLIFIFVPPAEPGTPPTDVQDVQPYAFATLPDGTTVYKMVHQGCEIFVADRYVSGFHDDSVSVSITTGRGCR